MATYDSNNVLFVKGNGGFFEPTVHSNLQYKYDEENHQNHFLQCINPNGEAKWSPLPEASSSKKRNRLLGIRLHQGERHTRLWYCSIQNVSSLDGRNKRAST